MAKRPDWASEMNKCLPKPIAIELFGETVERNMIIIDSLFGYRRKKQTLTFSFVKNQSRIKFSIRFNIYTTVKIFEEGIIF